MTSTIASVISWGLAPVIAVLILAVALDSAGSWLAFRSMVKSRRAIISRSNLVTVLVHIFAGVPKSSALDQLIGGLMVSARANIFLNRGNVDGVWQHTRESIASARLVTDRDKSLQAQIISVFDTAYENRYKMLVFAVHPHGPEHMVMIEEDI